MHIISYDIKIAVNEWEKPTGSNIFLDKPRNLIANIFRTISQLISLILVQ